MHYNQIGKLQRGLLIGAIIVNKITLFDENSLKTSLWAHDGFQYHVADSIAFDKPINPQRAGQPRDWNINKQIWQKIKNNNPKFKQFIKKWQEKPQIKLYLKYTTKDCTKSNHKALSLINPLGYALVFGFKTVENRKQNYLQTIFNVKLKKKKCINCIQNNNIDFNNIVVNDQDVIKKKKYLKTI